ncbi:putative YEATS domain-containing protein 2 [Apostichopus japonicus]|uniref:Putative YEATS domain-containing protein 2 n=1 Tax=Stichopus japonicus TaxID=307972 RepID=A0A2G8JLS9_STIJA|nr:putative YEATS domain-containing protein 2 [Apostichopus japonicus]
MASKRSSSYLGSDGSDQDPDYAMVTSSHPVKKQKLHQQDAKDTTVKKIENIIKKHFSVEIKNKEKEIDLADERIHQVRMMLDKLRACVVANFYGNAGRCPGSEKSKHKIDLNHPAVQRALGTNLESTIGSRASPDSLQAQDQQNGLVSELEVQQKDDELPPYTGEIKAGDRRSQLFSTSGQASRFHLKKRIIVGNVSKYITTENREDSDLQLINGWCTSEDPLKNQGLITLSRRDPPFHLTRRGWGEFPIRVQLHFNDPRSKKVDIIHHLKLEEPTQDFKLLVLRREFGNVLESKVVQFIMKL